MTQPKLLSIPFANIGEKNDIPDTTAPQPQQATMETGFPQITQTPIAEGGVPPERADFNGIFNIYGQHIVHLNKGLGYQYDSTFANKIGGYPLGATVVLDDGITEVQSVIEGNLANPNIDMQGWTKKGDAKFYVESIADLASIKNPKDGDVVFVNEINQFYTYNSASTEQENGVTVVGKWVMNVPDFYYASWFAKKDIQEPQDVSLQKGYAYATSKSRPFVIDGNFYLDGRLNSTGLENGNPTALLGLSNSHVIFKKGIGKLQIISNNYAEYSVFTICKNVENIILDNPHFIGDRKLHDYTQAGTHEWGYGLTIYESKNIVVNYPVIEEMTGDGLYIGKAWNSLLTTQPENITVTSPLIRGIRRNGYALTAGINVKVLNPTIMNVGTFDGIKGAAPMASIDIEPEEGPKTTTMSRIESCVVSNPTLVNATSAGIQLHITKNNRHVDLAFTGLTRCNNVASFLALRALPRVTDTTTKQTGTVLFEHVLATNTANYIPLNIGWHDTGLNLIVDKLEVNQKLELYMQSFANDTYNSFGSFAKFNSITLLGEKLIKIDNFYMDGGRDLAFFNYSMFLTNPHDVVTILQSGYTPKFGNSFKSNAVFKLKPSANLNTDTLPSNLSVDPTALNTAGLYVNTIGNFKETVVIVDVDTATVGAGVYVRNLNVVRGTNTYTQARSQEQGAWIKFKNISGGRTIIYDSFGTWVFS